MKNKKITLNQEDIIILKGIGFTDIKIEDNKVDGIINNIKCFNIDLERFGDIIQMKQLNEKIT